jgi:hypothetical protein
MTGADLRAWLLSLPEAEERETWGHPTFRVRDKMFASMSTDGRTAGLKATPEAQAELVAAEPAVYSVAAYVGRYGWVEIVVEGADPAELRDLAVQAWRRTAPKRLVAAYDAQPPGTG